MGSVLYFFLYCAACLISLTDCIKQNVLEVVTAVIMRGFYVVVVDGTTAIDL